MERLLFATSTVFICALDQLVKAGAEKVLAGRQVSLGRFGLLKVRRNPIWLAQVTKAHPLILCSVWLIAATTIFLATAIAPSAGIFGGLILGGSLGNLLDTLCYGSVRDLVWLRFWPGFNLADVAIVAGSLGLLVALSQLALDLL